MTSAITVLNSIRLSIRSVKALPAFNLYLIKFKFLMHMESLAKRPLVVFCVALIIC